MKLKNPAFRLLFFMMAVSASTAFVSADPDTSKPDASAKNLPQMIREAEKGVFFLRLMDASGKIIGAGTGFLVDDKGTLATALHVVRPPMRMVAASSVEAVGVGGEVCAVKGIIASDESLDLVLLRLEKTPPYALPLVLGDETPPERGSTVLVLGHPLEFRFVSTDGIISAVNKTRDLPDSLRNNGIVKSAAEVVWLQTSAAVSPGNSGGPMLDASGKVVGVIQWKTRTGPGMNFALHVPPLRALIAKPERLITVAEFGRSEAELNQVMTQFWSDLQKYVQSTRNTRSWKSHPDNDTGQAPAVAHPALSACPKLLKIAQENAGGDVEMRALTMVILTAAGRDTPAAIGTDVTQAAYRLLADYAGDKRILNLISGLIAPTLPELCEFLRGLIDKTNDPEIRAVAALRLAQGLAPDARSRAERDEIVRLAKLASAAKANLMVANESVADLASDLMEKTTHAVVGCVAPALSGKDHAGASADLGEMRGRHVVLAFWNSRDFFGATAKALDALEDKYAGTPLAIIGVQLADGGTASNDTASKARKWPTLRDGEDQALKKAWHVSTSPTVFLIDPKGNIAARYETIATISYSFGGVMTYQSSRYDETLWQSELNVAIERIPEIAGVRDELRTRLMACPWLSTDWYGKRERTVFLRENGKTSVKWISKWEARPPSGLHLHVEKIGCVDLQVDFSTGLARVTAPVSIASRVMRQRQMPAANSDQTASMVRLREMLVAERWDHFKNGKIGIEQPHPLRFLQDGTTDHATYPAWETLSDSRFRVYLDDGMYWTYNFDAKTKTAHSDMTPPAEGANDGEIRDPKAIAVSGSARNDIPDLAKTKAACTGAFNDRVGWQEQRFPATAGRHVCLQINSSLNDLPFSALAELELIDENGAPLPTAAWKVEYANTEPSGQFWPKLAWDGRTETFWHSPYAKQTIPHPHLIIIDTGSSHVLSGIRIQQRKDHPNGRIKDFRLYVQDKAWSQDAPATATATPASSPKREWTNLDGIKITADYLGTQGPNVVLKLSNGTLSEVPLVKLCAADNEFIRLNPVEYHVPWQAWPKEKAGASLRVEVAEETADAGGFVYTTRNFKFHSDVNLGMGLMTDLARVFELTHELHIKSPFGILAKPENKRFEARLFGTADSYRKAGGSEKTAGIYLHKERIFMAPLDLMGVRKGSAGWRIVREEYDPGTVIHELTHMLTHDMLDNLPTWANEGYAEYIKNIPIEGKRFKTSPGEIREGIHEMYVREYEKSRTRPDTKMVRLGKDARIAFLKGTELPELFKVEKVLRMTDHEWATGSKSAPPPADRKPSAPGAGPMVFTDFSDPKRLPRLYRTAHLIIYYYIQIEGEKGVDKIRRFLEENRRNLAKYEQYREQYRIYEQEMRHFMELPGVTQTPDGRIRHPSNLQPPTAPKPPFTDPNTLKQGGLSMLLAGESPADVGRRIEDALIKDLGMNLKFVEKPNSMLLPPKFKP